MKKITFKAGRPRKPALTLHDYLGLGILLMGYSIVLIQLIFYFSKTC